MDQVKSLKYSLYTIWSDMVCFNWPYHVNIFKGCIAQTLFTPFLNPLFDFTFKIKISYVISKTMKFAASRCLKTLDSCKYQTFSWEKSLMKKVENFNKNGDSK